MVSTKNIEQYNCLVSNQHIRMNDHVTLKGILHFFWK